MADRFWVGGSGHWNPTDTSHWSNSSGGASGATVPTETDDVYFDANSFSANGAIVTVDHGTTSYFLEKCKNLDFSGITHSATFYFDNSDAVVEWQNFGYVKLAVYGNLVLSELLTIDAYAENVGIYFTPAVLQMVHPAKDITITSNACKIQRIAFDIIGTGRIDLIDDLSVDNFWLGNDWTPFGDYNLPGGDFYTNDFSLECNNFHLENSNFYPGDSLIYIHIRFICTQGVNDSDFGTSTIIFQTLEDKGIYNMSLQFQGSVAFYNVEIHSGNMVFARDADQNKTFSFNDLYLYSGTTNYFSTGTDYPDEFNVLGRFYSEGTPEDPVYIYSTSGIT